MITLECITILILIIFSRAPPDRPASMEGHYSGFPVDFYGNPSLEWFDYLFNEDVSEEGSIYTPPVVGFPENQASFVVDKMEDQESQSSNTMNYGSNEIIHADGGMRIALRTKSELDVLDDGFKWRKYGKKQVKNSPNPRNYYKCSSNGCSVKKRVQRDQDDPSYVITTYDGVHSHESPSIIYCTPGRPGESSTGCPSEVALTRTWSLQATAYSSS